MLWIIACGGGSAILHQLKHAGYDWMDMRHIFVTHKHVDHLMGIIWMVRMICQFMNLKIWMQERSSILRKDPVIIYGNLFIPDDLESLEL